MPRRPFEPRDIKVLRDADGWRFSFLGTERRYGAAIDWPATGSAREQLWAMNLHYMEYLEALPGADGLSVILDWITHNPLSRPGATQDAWNPYALSLRTVCWMQWLAEQGAIIPSADCDRIAHSLARQLAWLARRPETDIGGNHLIKNIKALLWGAACFDGVEADRWQRVATRLLVDELDRQVLADGMHFERSPSYHAQVTADLIECRAVAPTTIRELIDRRLGMMLDAATLMAHPDGAAAQFNDAGLTMAYRPASLVRAVSDKFATVGSSFGLLPVAGLAALRTDRFSTFAKFGQIGADSLPAHAHGDIGSIELSFGHERLIVDQGVYEYVAGERRAISRHAAFHNVTTPNGRDMAAFFGAFRCGYRPKPILHAASAAPDRLTIDVEHHGFSASDGGSTAIRRAIGCNADVIAIEDSVSGGGDATWISRFLVHPGWICSRTEDGLSLISPSAEIRFAADANIRIEDAVWWPDMGVEIATKRLVVIWPIGRTSLKMRFFSC